MGETTTSVVGGGAGGGNDAETGKLRSDIADTRNEMSNTIEELHGRLNPVVLKDQALEQFHETVDTVKTELKSHFADAKEAMRGELQEAKESVRNELTDAKSALKAEVLDELAQAKQRFNEEMVNAKAAVREATIGKMQHMVQGAQDSVRGAGRSVVDTVRENPLPAALIGAGLAWLFNSSRRNRAGNQGRVNRGGGRRFEANNTYSSWDVEERGGYDAFVDDGGRGQGAIAGAAHSVQHAAAAGAHRVSDIAQQAGAKASQLAHDAGSAVQHLAQNVGGSVSSAASQVQHQAADMGRSAMSNARRLRSRGSDYYETNPLAVGAIVLATGVAIGLTMPRTDLEDEWLGSTRDELADRASELAHETIAKAGTAADHMAESLSSDHNDNKQPSA